MLGSMNALWCDSSIDHAQAAGAAVVELPPTGEQSCKKLVHRSDVVSRMTVVTQ